MSCDVVQRAAGGEGKTGIETILLYQMPRACFKTLAEKTVVSDGRERDSISLHFTLRIQRNDQKSIDIVPNELASLPNLNHGHSRFHPGLHVVPNLSMYLSRAPIILKTD